jgi:hypothetical protein
VTVSGVAGFIQVVDGVFVRASEIVEVNAREVRTRSGLTYIHKTLLTDMMQKIRACERSERASRQ